MKTANKTTTAKFGLQKKIVTRFSHTQTSTKPNFTSLDTWSSFM